MRSGRLYLKIFLSFIVILVLTEFLIFGLFELYIRGRFRVAFRATYERQGPPERNLLAELIEDQIVADPSAPISENKNLQSLLHRLGRVYQAKIWITSPGGEIILQSFDGPPPPVPQEYPDRRREHVFFFRLSPPPRPSLFMFVPLEREGQNFGRLSLFRERFNERFEDEPSAALLGLALAGIGGFIALLLLPISGLITNPIKELHRSALRIAKGDLSHRVDIRIKDEIGDLGDAFNQMAGEIERMVRGNKELTANISHELRSPLARIRVAEELIREELDGRDGNVLKYLDRICQEVGELDSLIGQVLSLSKLDMSEKPFQMGKVIIESVMIEVLERVKPLILKNGLRIKSEMAPGIPPVWGDREAIKTALSNLIDNAVKFSPSGGEVGVSIKPEGGGVRVKLTNECDPIPEDDLKRIFDPFYRVENGKKKIQGAGLGLAITKKIVEGHAGTIEAANLGWGLQFSVYFPASYQLERKL